MYRYACMYVVCATCNEKYYYKRMTQVLPQREKYSKDRIIKHELNIISLRNAMAFLLNPKYLNYTEF